MSFRVRSSFTGVGRPRLVAASGQLPRTLVSGYPFKQGGWCRNFIEKKEWVKGSDEVSSQNDSEVTFIMNKIQSAQSEAITLSVEFGNLKKHYLRAEVRMSDQMFSCSTCRLWLSSVDEQRAHFQTPLHAFNVRRKVVNMVPVSQDQFDEKLAESQADSKAEKAASVPVVLACQACNKKFKSSEMLEQHLQSKKHIKAADGKSAEDVVVKKAVKVVSEETEEGGADAVEKRIEKGRRLGFLECIFCSKTSASAEETAEHMSECHSFFIPDVEYLVDLAGLLSYLGDKVGVGFCCVFCHRVFESVQAARQHMEALSHAKMVYGDDEDAEAGEFDEFYEFVSTYDDETVKQLPVLSLSEDGTQLRLGDSGKAIGHRDMRVYYDQVVRDKDKQIVIRGGAGGGHRLLKKYKQLGWTGVAGTSLETVAARREKQMAFRKMQSEKLTAGMQTTKVNGRYFRRRDIHW